MVEATIDELLEKFYEHCITCSKIKEYIAEEEREYHIANEMQFQTDYLIYEKFTNGEMGMLCCDMIGCKWRLRFDARITYVGVEVME